MYVPKQTQLLATNIAKCDISQVYDLLTGEWKQKHPRRILLPSRLTIVMCDDHEINLITVWHKCLTVQDFDKWSSQRF